MKRILTLILLTAAAATLAIILWPAPAIPGSSAALESFLIEDDRTSEQYARALAPGQVAFPRDLGPHEAFQAEWWYYTGNLETAEGRPFGFQFTIFRRALTPEETVASVVEPSAWRSNQVYMAHLAVSDIANETFYSAERFSRGGAGLAGAAAEPYRVWLENWQAEEVSPGRVRLQADAGEFALDLVLQETLPPILHGDGGLSQKGPEPGQATYYYSIIRQETEGTIAINGDRYLVTGLSWKDHEYATDFLPKGTTGWDWISLQLDDGSAITLFEIRRADGSLEPASKGSYIHPDGTVEELLLADWQLETLDSWTSPSSGATYPAGWRLVIPEQDLVLEGRSFMADQEMNLSTVYWEGAVSFSGTRGGEPVNGNGYIEMTGYASPMDRRL